jgi:thioredoxin reductase
VIVGAGPAGLSAAVYMGRFRRRTLVLDCGDGRWSYGQINHNYLGFPAGVTGIRLHELGRAQAERFGVTFQDAEVTKVGKDGQGFRLTTTKGPHRARTLIWAAGVHDRWPDFERARRLVGKHLFWCIVCDGWRTRDLRLLVLGNSDPCVGTTLQFLTYTRKVTYLCDRTQGRPSSRARAKLAQAGIAYVEGAYAGRRQKDCIRRVVLDDKRTSRPTSSSASTAAIRAPSSCATARRPRAQRPHPDRRQEPHEPCRLLRGGRLRQQAQPSGRHGRARGRDGGAGRESTSCIRRCRRL